MENFAERGITIRNPEKFELDRIVEAQSKFPDRRIIAEWLNEERNRVVSIAEIIPSLYKNSLEEKEYITSAIVGADRLTIKILLDQPISAPQKKKPHLDLPVAIKKPTTQQLVRLLEAQKENPELSINYFTDGSETVFFVPMDANRTKDLLESLRKQNPTTPYPGTIIIHRSQKI